MAIFVIMYQSRKSNNSGGCVKRVNKKKKRARIAKFVVSNQQNQTILAHGNKNRKNGRITQATGV